MFPKSPGARAWLETAYLSLDAASKVNSAPTLANQKKKLSELQLALECLVKALIIFIVEEGKRLLPGAFTSLLAGLSSQSLQQAVETTHIVEAGILSEIESKVMTIIEIYQNPKIGGHTPLRRLFDEKLINTIASSTRSALNFLSMYKKEFSEGAGIPVDYISSFLQFHRIILHNYNKIEAIFLGREKNKFTKIIRLTQSLEEQITFFDRNRFKVMVWHVASIHLVNGIIGLSGSLKESEERRLREFDTSVGEVFLKMCNSRTVPAELDWIVTILKCYLMLITYAPLVTYLEDYWQAAKYPASGMIDAELLEHVDVAQRMIKKLFDNVEHLLA